MFDGFSTKLTIVYQSLARYATLGRGVWLGMSRALLKLGGGSGEILRDVYL